MAPVEGKDSVRMVIDLDGMTDPLLSPNDSNSSTVELVGLHLRRYNDELPFHVLPGSRVILQKGDKIIQKGRLKLTSSEYEDTDLAVLRILGRADAACELKLPRRTSPYASNYFNLSFQCGQDSVELVRIGKASRMIGYGQFESDSEQMKLEEGRHLEFQLRPDTCLGIVTAAQSHYFWITLRYVTASAESTLRLSFDNNTITIFGEFGDTGSAEFCAFVHPTKGPELLGGFRTMSLIPSELTLSIDPELAGPRIFHWLSCVRSDNLDFPIAFPPIRAPRMSLPSLFVWDNSAHGWYAPRSLNARQLFKFSKKLMMFGNDTAATFRSIVQREQYQVIGLVSTEKDNLSKALETILTAPLTIQPNVPTWRTYGKTEILTLYSPDIENSARLLEDLFIELSDRPPEKLPDDIRQASAHHKENRLEPIPFCPDLAVGMITTVLNTVRGRLPSNANSETANYDNYAKNYLWMIPWSKKITRESLLAELNIRCASEYEAARAFVELYGGAWEGTPTQTTDSADLRQTIFQNFDAWEHWWRVSEDQKKEDRHRALELRARASPDQVMHVLAEAAYESCSCSGYFEGRQTRKEGLAHVNPLVIVYASGGEDRFDTTLDFNSAYWALFAARLSGDKCGAIVATLRNQSITNSVKRIQVELREAMHSDTMTELNKREIRELRTNLMTALLASVEPATYEVLEKLNPDRIIVFSDLMIDHLPYKDSLLGLEYAVSRYPSSIPAAIAVTRAAASAFRYFSYEQVRAAVLFAPEAVDAATVWAKDVSTGVTDLLELLGCSVSQPVESSESTKSLLDKIERFQIIVFVGHAEASLNWGGLGLGKLTIPVGALAERDWSDSFVLLLGCETAAIDAEGTDIAASFLQGGARAVIGTTATISVDVANVFLQTLFERLIAGIPVDYAFLLSKRKAFTYEALKSVRGEENAIAEIAKVFDSNVSPLGMSDILGRVGLTCEQAILAAPYALSLTLIGGAGERLI